jgi:hypothetical protein
VKFYGEPVRTVKVSSRNDNGFGAVDLGAVTVVDVGTEVLPPRHVIIVIDGFIRIELNLDVIASRIHGFVVTTVVTNTIDIDLVVVVRSWGGMPLPFDSALVHDRFENGMRPTPKRIVVPDWNVGARVVVIEPALGTRRSYPLGALEAWVWNGAVRHLVAPERIFWHVV